MDVGGRGWQRGEEVGERREGGGVGEERGGGFRE